MLVAGRQALSEASDYRRAARFSSEEGDCLEIQDQWARRSRSAGVLLIHNSHASSPSSTSRRQPLLDLAYNARSPSRRHLLPSSGGGGGSRDDIQMFWSS